jgi:hypothetical protein
MAGKTAFLDKIEPLANTIRRGYANYFEEFLDGKFPDFDWRSARENSGYPLPEADKEKLKRADFEAWKRDFASRMVPQLLATPAAAIDAVNLVADRCDAYVTHSVSVIRDALVSGYHFEDNSNDFHDGMQLLYLSRKLYCFVADDAGLIRRVSKSSQRERVLSIDDFVSA